VVVHHIFLLSLAYIIVADYIFVLFVVTFSFAMYCYFIFLYLFLCTIPFMLHSLLSSDYYTIYFVMFLLCICAVLAVPASLHLSVVIDCGCLIFSYLCVDLLYTCGKS